MIMIYGDSAGMNTEQFRILKSVNMNKYVNEGKSGDDMYWYYGEFILHCKPVAFDAGSDSTADYFMNKQPSSITNI